MLFRSVLTIRIFLRSWSLSWYSYSGPEVFWAKRYLIVLKYFKKASRQDRKRFWWTSTILLLALPWLIGATGGNYWVRALDFALLYVVLALGLNVVIGFAGLLDLGYIAFYAVGAYSYALLASPHLTSQFPAIASAFPQGLHFPLWGALIISFGLAALFGVL